MSPAKTPLKGRNKQQCNQAKGVSPKRLRGCRGKLSSLQRSNAFKLKQNKPNEKLNKSYENELADFIALRKSDEHPSTSTIVTIPSQELLWIRNGAETQQQHLEPMSHSIVTPESIDNTQIINIDDEIEEGEIVEQEVTNIVNLLQESFDAVQRSKQINDQVSPVKDALFYEDRTSLKSGEIPKYNTFRSDNEPTAANLNESSESDVICLGTQSDDNDDSVVCLGEVKATTPEVSAKFVSPLRPPDCLKKPAVRKLMKLVPSPSPLRKSAPKRPSDGKVKRFNLWKQKKKIEFLARKSGELPAKPSTSAESMTEEAGGSSPDPSEDDQEMKAVTEPKEEDKLQKRIILIDGSNVAMQYLENHGTKKTDKDFSAEGENFDYTNVLSTIFYHGTFTGLKIVIDHFENLGFQVKAIIPEYRVRRDKSSNHILMTDLKNKGKLMCTPSKCYDDRIIWQAALKLDAAVVSNDHYREFIKISLSLRNLINFILSGDLMNEKPEFRELVPKRLIRFNWLFQELIIPEDPHGRLGPKLNDILYKTP